MYIMADRVNANLAGKKVCVINYPTRPTGAIKAGEKGLPRQKETDDGNVNKGASLRCHRFVSLTLHFARGDCGRDDPPLCVRRIVHFY